MSLHILKNRGCLVEFYSTIFSDVGRNGMFNRQS